MRRVIVAFAAPDREGCVAVEQPARDAAAGHVDRQLRVAVAAHGHDRMRLPVGLEGRSPALPRTQHRRLPPADRRGPDVVQRHVVDAPEDRVDLVRGRVDLQAAVQVDEPGLAEHSHQVADQPAARAVQLRREPVSRQRVPPRPRRPGVVLARQRHRRALDEQPRRQAVRRQVRVDQLVAIERVRRVHGGVPRARRRAGAAVGVRLEVDARRRTCST